LSMAPLKKKLPSHQPIVNGMGTLAMVTGMVWVP
jgi:acyl dehydratase